MKQISKPDSNMAENLELSCQKFKTIVINMLKDLMEKVDTMQE